MDDTIVAISTPQGASAISIIRVSGSDSLEIVNEIFDRNIFSFNSNTINYGHIVYENNIIDEVLLSVFLAPKTYTKENIVEINTHGGISVTNKIKKEAPFHALTNAGHITYIELDGDAAANVEAFEKVVRIMKENGIGYGAINHPVDRDPVCGYVGVIGDVCPRCGRHDHEAVSVETLRSCSNFGCK